MNVIILGAGMIGKAIAYDMARTRNIDEITQADVSLQAVKDSAKLAGIKRINPVKVDLDDTTKIKNLMKKSDVAIGAVSYRYNYKLSQIAISTGTNFCDLGGNNDVVKQQLSLNKQAKDADITIIPDCGLSPGMTSIISMRAIEELGKIDDLKIRVGGLPLHPKPPLEYKLVFSAEGLINEYYEKAIILRNGRIVKIDSLTELEAISFPHPFEKLEAFITSGGTSTLPFTLKSMVKNLDDKTIRYPGHCEKMRAMLGLGLGSTQSISVRDQRIVPRELFIELMKRFLQNTDKDVVLVRIIATKKTNGGKRGLKFELIDYGLPERGITAMMKTTAFPASAIAWMLGSGKVNKKGAIPQELCIPSQEYMGELAKRAIKFNKCEIIQSKTTNCSACAGNIIETV